jgi:hypothetical protein
MATALFNSPEVDPESSLVPLLPPIMSPTVAAPALFTLLALISPCITAVVLYRLRRLSLSGPIDPTESGLLCRLVCSVLGQVVLPLTGTCAGLLGIAVALLSFDERQNAFRVLHSEQAVMIVLFRLARKSSLRCLDESDLTQLCHSRREFRGINRYITAWNLLEAYLFLH